MHPALQLRRLTGLDKEIVDALAVRPEGLPQVRVGERVATKVSQTKLSRAMSSLVARGLLRKEGTTRGRFLLTDDAIWFARPPQLRPVVRYDPARIGSYEPNRSRWLPEMDRARMEAAAKGVEHQLDASTYSRQIAERFLIDLSWASSALEGNTYDYLDSEALIKFGQHASGHDLVEATMMLNHKRAIAQLLDKVGDNVLMPQFAARLHAMLMRDLLAPEDLGRIRANEVGIGGSAYRPAIDARILTADLGALLWKAGEVADPFEASFFLLLGLSYLQGFADGNKRLSRLFCNVPLLWHGKPPMSFVGVDKADYLTGLIVFYELADPSVLGHVVAVAYERTAPTYSAAVATRRIPRSIELQQRHRIEAMVQEYVASAIAAQVQVPKEFAASRMPDVADADKRVLTESFAEIVAALTPENAAAWGVEASDAQHFADLPKAGQPTLAGQLSLFGDARSNSDTASPGAPAPKSARGRSGK